MKMRMLTNNEFLAALECVVKPTKQAKTTIQRKPIQGKALQPKQLKTVRQNDNLTPCNPATKKDQ